MADPRTLHPTPQLKAPALDEACRSHLRDLLNYAAFLCRGCGETAFSPYFSDSFSAAA